LRLAIISDVHGNLAALEAVISSITSLGCDRVVCLGDIVGYGARPNECVGLLASEGIPCILGNHDAAAIGRLGVDYMNSYARSAIEWTVDTLNPGAKSFLLGLELVIQSEEAFFVHSSPNRPEAWQYIFNISEATQTFDSFQQSVCFIGHTHFPIIFTSPRDGRRLINVGSVGQPRDRDPRACYGLYDTKSSSFRWERVEYSIAETASQILAAGLPRFLAERLAGGI
jgi:diadenosine tetraphosphatase ApaH/serine/threonine PP2A family protein phosphatase